MAGGRGRGAVVLACCAAMLTTGCTRPGERVAPATATVTPLDHLPVLRGDYFRIDSAVLGRPFHIYLRYPAGYDPAAAARYPTVYLLDGDSLFPLLGASHIFLHYDDGVPEALVVGIAYGSFDPPANRRVEDFTPPGMGLGPEPAGAARFERFLKEELLPRIERDYRSDPARRILFGQSRGGTFVLHSAFSDPDLFWARIASNAALEPSRRAFHGTPAQASRDDLHLIYASGTRDRPAFREAALAWFEAWRGRRDAPWRVHPIMIEGGTHAADAPRVYRQAMNLLFRRESAARR